NRRARDRFQAEDRGETDLGANLRRFLEIKLALLEPHRAALAAVLREAVDPGSALSPTSRESGPVLEESLALFSRLATRAGLDDPSLPRLLWAAHLAFLVCWLHDRSEGARESRRLLGAMERLPALLPALAAMPGFGELREVLAALVRVPEPLPAVAPAGAEPPRRGADLVVLGAGPIGLMAAMFLKRDRPRTRIVVLEKLDEPGHKIGESTLSGFCKALRTVGIPKEAMRRLFYPKHGLDFLHIEESTREITRAP